jgi:hypothetical protein
MSHLTRSLASHPTIRALAASPRDAALQNKVQGRRSSQDYAPEDHSALTRMMPSHGQTSRILGQELTLRGLEYLVLVDKKTEIIGINDRKNVSTARGRPSLNLPG